MFAGFTGTGLLTAGISGDIFASPPSKKIVKLIINMLGQQKHREVLFLVANYTGDRLNFAQAKESLRTLNYNIDMFVFGEDMAFYGQGKRTGRRGLAGISLMIKMAGALADEGLSMAMIKEKLEYYTKQIGTISLALTPCIIPGRGISFNLKPDEMEVGLGAHGEAGVAKVKLMNAKDSVHKLIGFLLDEKSSLLKSIKLNNNRVVVLLNNLGGLSQFEINLVAGEVVKQLNEFNLVIERIYSGNY